LQKITNSNRGVALVVDDTEINLILLKEILQGPNLKVLTAKSAEEAFAEIANHKPDIILLDIMMPKIDGYAVCKQLKSKEDTKDIPVIFISAAQDLNFKLKAFKSGGVDYIAKPFEAEEVKARVKTHMTVSSLQHELMAKNSLLKKAEEEKELNELKARFVSMASHEFRTPLAAISFASGFMKKYWNKISDEDRIKKFEKIETQVKHMTSLLDDVLTFGKTENRKMISKPEVYSFDHFFSPIFEEVFVSTNNSHKIKFTGYSDKDTIYIDKSLGRNIFINLLTNAIKFSPSKSFIEFSVESNSEECCFCVKDYGIGISEKELKSIFIPFNRGKNVETIQGTGLGLAIVKESLDILGGKINVQSKEGEFTIIQVIIPKRQLQEQK